MDTAHELLEPTAPELIDSFRAARLLDLPHASLIRLVKARAVPCYVLPGEVVKFDERELRRWLVAHRQDTEARTK